jgi:hypothetical protein
LNGENLQKIARCAGEAGATCYFLQLLIQNLLAEPEQGAMGCTVIELDLQGAALACPGIIRFPDVYILV